MSNCNSDLPDGQYVAEILDMTSSKNAKGVPVVEWKLKIVGGPRDQLEVSKVFYLTNDKAKAFLTKELGILGIDVQNGQQFIEKKSKCIGKRIRIQAVTSDEGWSSFYLKGVLDGDATGKEEDDDDLGW